MILPEEPIRGRTFEEYLGNAWLPDDDGRNFMAEMACIIAKIDLTTLRVLPKVFQVYWFEQARSLMLDALREED